MTVGENIRSFRKKRKLTQKKLGELSGLNEVTIRKYESGKVIPKLNNLSKIALALNVDVFFLEERYMERYETEIMPQEDVNSLKERIDSDYYGYTKEEKQCLLLEIQNEEMTANGDSELLKQIYLKYEQRILTDILHRFDEYELHSLLTLLSAYESLETGARHKIEEYASDLCEIPFYKKSFMP